MWIHNRPKIDFDGDESYKHLEMTSLINKNNIAIEKSAGTNFQTRTQIKAIVEKKPWPWPYHITRGQ